MLTSRNEEAASRPPAILAGDFGFTLVRGSGRTSTRRLFGKAEAVMTPGVPVDFLVPTSATVVDEDGAVLEYDLVRKKDAGLADYARFIVCNGAMGLSAGVLICVLVAFALVTPFLSKFTANPVRTSIVTFVQMVKSEGELETAGFGIIRPDPDSVEVGESTKNFLRKLKETWR